MSRNLTNAVVETLEARKLMSGSPLTISETSYAGGSQLKVIGTAGDDQITVSLNETGLTITNGDWSTTKAGSFKSLLINAAAGNDSVSIAADVTVDAIVYGGAGSDTISAGAGNDRLYGGLGKNSLNGNAGDDVLVTIGGAANDTLAGGLGNDQFWMDDRSTETVTDASAIETAGYVHKVSTFSNGSTISDGASTDGVSASKAELKAEKLAAKLAKQQAKLAAKARKLADKAAKAEAKRLAKEQKNQQKNQSQDQGDINDNGANNTAADTTVLPTPAPAPAPAPAPVVIVEVEPTPTGNDLTGQNFADPSTNNASITYKTFSNKPLFADNGPTSADVAQGYVGDCYFLATLAAIADANAAQIENSVVDLGDGTYAVEFTKNNKSVYVRVDADLPTWNGSNTPAYAKLGAQDSMWVAIMEKAFTCFRTAQSSYASIEAGWMSEAATALGLASKSAYSATSGEALLNAMANDLEAGKAVTYAAGTIVNGAPLVGYHAYQVVSVNFENGHATTLTLRNPWGVDGAGNDGNNDAHVTITAAQAQQCFLGWTAAAA
jgi:hypothetical protein